MIWELHAQILLDLIYVHIFNQNKPLLSDNISLIHNIQFQNIFFNK